MESVIEERDGAGGRKRLNAAPVKEAETLKC